MVLLSGSPGACCGSQKPYMPMHSERALLLARVLLLLHLIRGAHGVVAVAFVVSGKQHLRNFMADEMSEKTWKLLAKAVRRRLKKVKKKRMKV